jgi:hypothetical protein
MILQFIVELGRGGNRSFRNCVYNFPRVLKGNDGDTQRILIIIYQNNET